MVQAVEIIEKLKCPCGHAVVLKNASPRLLSFELNHIQTSACIDFLQLISTAYYRCASSDIVLRRNGIESLERIELTQAIH